MVRQPMKRLFISLCQSRFEDACAGPVVVCGPVAVPWACGGPRRRRLLPPLVPVVRGGPAERPCPPSGALSPGAEVFYSCPGTGDGVSRVRSSSCLCGSASFVWPGKAISRAGELVVARLSPLALATAKPVSEAVPVSQQVFVSGLP